MKYFYYVLLLLLCFVVVTIRCNNEVRSAKMQFTPGEDPLGGANPEYVLQTDLKIQFF
jgi:hypothetical protein